MDESVLVAIAIRNWKTQISRIDEFLKGISNDMFTNKVAQGRNRIHYIIGHLIAVNDTMMHLLEIGNRKFQDLDEIFVKNPDGSFPLPHPDETRKNWKIASAELTKLLENIPSTEWSKKHSSISEMDFKSDPLRNKFSVLLNRTNHMSYHLGQLILFH